MKITLFVLILGFFFLFSCEKQTIDKSIDNILIINFTGSKIDTFLIDGFPYYQMFGYNNYKSRHGDYVINFDIGDECLACTYWNLSLFKKDSIIMLDHSYVSNVNPDINVGFVEEYGWSDDYRSSTKTEIRFSKFEYRGKVEGTFKAYLNNSVWCTGSFNLNSKLP